MIGIYKTLPLLAMVYSFHLQAVLLPSGCFIFYMIYNKELCHQKS